MNVKIMIVDAHPVYVSKTAGFLESLTFKDIIIIPKGAKALESILQHSPDIVILSATMPDADSLTLAANIKAQSPAPFLIVQTGLLTTPQTVQAFKSAGAEHVIARREKDWTPFEGAIAEILSAKCKSG